MSSHLSHTNQEGCPVAPESFAHLVSLDTDMLSAAQSVMADIRDCGPVAWSPTLQAFVVTRYSEVQQVLGSPTVFASGIGNPQGPVFARQVGMIVDRLLSESPDFKSSWLGERATWASTPCLLDTDAPLHTRQRRSVARIFTPGKVRALEPLVTETANALVDGFAAAGRCDIVSDYSSLLALDVMARQLGVELDRLVEFRSWANDLLAAIGNDGLVEEDLRRIADSRTAFHDYFAPIIRDRMKSPRDDIISLVASTVDDAGELVSMDERLRYCQRFLTAGTHTSAATLAEGVALLARSPELVEAIREDADGTFIDNFVEELLRVAVPVQALYRTTASATTLASVHIPSGSSVLVLFASANMDERQFPDADVFDPHRDNVRGHLTFGKGEHFCIGASLARSEIRLGLTVLIDRIWPWTMVSDAVDYSPSFMLRAATSCPITFEPTEARAQ